MCYVHNQWYDISRATLYFKSCSRHFEGTWRLHLQGLKIQEECIKDFQLLKMKATVSF